MDYYYAIYFFDGKMLTITAEEMDRIKADLSRGAEFIQVQGNFINVKNIARIGEHESTAQMKTMNRASVENRLITQGREKLVEERKEKEKIRAINNTLKKQRFEEADFESENEKMLMEAEEPMFYIDKETGEKMYS